ncbi:hypothetical protein ACIBL8_01105 [Streptomyces sp. NPDC050523]
MPLPLRRHPGYAAATQGTAAAGAALSAMPSASAAFTMFLILKAATPS